MENNKKLNRAEMKAITGGFIGGTIWYCADTEGGPSGPPGTCSTTDPHVFCGQFSCYDTGVTCNIGKFCP
jgi:hypothetical protein